MSAVVDEVRTFSANALPNSWSAISLADIVRSDGVFVDGDWVESKDQDPQGDVRLIQLADIGDGEYRDRSERFLTSQKARELGCTFLEPGDVLVARMPDPLGRACIFPGDVKRAVTVVDVAVVRPRNPELNTRWLMYCINAPQFRRVVASMQSGSTRQRISRKNLAKIVFLLPPRRVQDNIVAEIEKQFSRLDQAVASLQRVKAQLKRYKAAVLKAAVEGRLVETEAERARREGRGFETGAELAAYGSANAAGGRKPGAALHYETGEQLLKRILETRRSQWKGKGKYKEPAAPETAGLPELPEGWAWATVDQLLASLRNGLSKKPEDLPPGIPILRISAVRPLELGIEDHRFYRLAPNEDIRGYQLRKNDLLFVRYNGTKELVGVCALVNSVLELLLYPDKLIRGQVVHVSAIAPAFVALAANVGVSRQHVEELIKTTAGQQGIAGGEIKRMPIPLPPLAEQHRIVAEVDRRLSIVREVEAEVDANLKRAQALRQAVLARAFSCDHGNA